MKIGDLVRFFNYKPYPSRGCLPVVNISDQWGIGIVQEYTGLDVEVFWPKRESSCMVDPRLLEVVNEDR